MRALVIDLKIDYRFCGFGTVSSGPNEPTGKRSGESDSPWPSILTRFDLEDSRQAPARAQQDALLLQAGQARASAVHDRRKARYFASSSGMSLQSLFAKCTARTARHNPNEVAVR